MHKPRSPKQPSQLEIFAMVKNADHQRLYFRIALPPASRDLVADKFLDSIKIWVELTSIPFAIYRPEKHEVFQIQSFPISDELQPLADQPTEFELLSDDSLEGRKLCGYVAVFRSKDEVAFAITAATQQHILSSAKSWFSWTKDQFKPLSTLTISIGGSLSAYIDPDGKLLFKSFHSASQRLNMESFYREASDEDVREILNHPKIRCSPDRVDEIIGYRNSRLRKLFGLLRHNKILSREDVTPKLINERAASIDPPIIIKYTGENDNRIELPDTETALIRALKVLCEQIYEGFLTRDLMETNSHRPLQIDEE